MLKTLSAAIICIVILNDPCCAKTSQPNLSRPSYNPGGKNFEEDKEFYKSYNKYSSESSDDSGEQTQKNEIPGANLISEQVILKLSKNTSVTDVANCIKNLEIPKNIQITSRCVSASEANKENDNSSNPNYNKKHQPIKKNKAEDLEDINFNN